MDFLFKFFTTEGFMPHKHCYLIEEGVFWLNTLSDTAIALAYFAIPVPLFIREFPVLRGSSDSR